MNAVDNNIMSKCKHLIIDGLTRIISNYALYKMIVDKINKLNVIVLNEEDFKKKYAELNGKGLEPGGFTYREVVYLKNSCLTEHIIIHEMLHGISEYYFDYACKRGLFVANRKENYMYGSGFNEAFTEIVASIITKEEFSSYSKDFKLVFELFMYISNLNIEEIMSLYLQQNEWLDDEVIDKFDKTNKSLPNLVIEYDNKSAYSERKYNPNNVMKIILDAINNKMNENEKIENNQKIMDTLKELNNYFYHVDFELDDDLKNRLCIILDKLGTYNIKNRSV